jgi:hypothetical protein
MCGVCVCLFDWVSAAQQPELAFQCGIGHSAGVSVQVTSHGSEGGDGVGCRQATRVPVADGVVVDEVKNGQPQLPSSPPGTRPSMVTDGPLYI